MALKNVTLKQGAAMILSGFVLAGSIGCSSKGSSNVLPEEAKASSTLNLSDLYGYDVSKGHERAVLVQSVGFMNQVNELVNDYIDILPEMYANKAREAFNNMEIEFSHTHFNSIYILSDPLNNSANISLGGRMLVSDSDYEITRTIAMRLLDATLAKCVNIPNDKGNFSDYDYKMFSRAFGEYASIVLRMEYIRQNPDYPYSDDIYDLSTDAHLFIKNGNTLPGGQNQLFDLGFTSDNALKDAFNLLNIEKPIDVSIRKALEHNIAAYNSENTFEQISHIIR